MEKDNLIILFREKKSGLASLPAPFVVSTSLNVNNRGRSSSLTRATSTRSARSGFNAAKLSSAKEILVEGRLLSESASLLFPKAFFRAIIMIGW